MGNQLRFSEHPLSQRWLAQFHTSEDRARAARLLNHLKLVSTREFESAIEQSLTDLQKRLNARIAVYPVIPPIDKEIVGYDPFSGGIPKSDDVKSAEVGRRRKFGSEDRVGHILAKLQDRFKNNSDVSKIECAPTLTQLKTQGIRHVVLVDDVCGSGKRITDYWQWILPRRIKSLLSLKNCELWIVLHTIAPAGRKMLKRVLSNFPIADHLITTIPEAVAGTLLSDEFRDLCVVYGGRIGMNSVALGYRESWCHVVFEHGCPNNLPAMLWANRGTWKALFPNQAIPSDLRPCFDDDGAERSVELLWSANQPKLALGLLDALDHSAPFLAEQRLLLTMLGLRLRGVTESNLTSRLLIRNSESHRLLGQAAEMGLYEKTSGLVTPLGKEFVSRFRERFGRVRQTQPIGRSPAAYYPSQCEGKLRKPGKTDGEGPPVPVEPR